jgi:hypothetical protein
MSTAISNGQLRRLQTLYGRLCAHSMQSAEREARLAWASELVKRPIASFSDLAGQEAKQLIDTLQGQLGVPESRQRPRRRGARRLDAEAARKAGTEGRRGFESKEATMAGAAEFARIQYALDELGWSQDQLDAWLRSPRSPLGKSNPRIVTLGDANRVWWALKRMLDRRARKEGSR